MANTLYELLSEQFKVKSRASESDVSVGDAQPATLLVTNNPNRTGLAISNTSSASIYISSNPGMETTSGFLINPNGGNIVLNWRDDFEMVGYAWYAIASVDASTVHIIENIIL